MALNSIILVSCVGMKEKTPRKAKDLYCSPWFKKARVYAERSGLKWFIISAKYGLISPDAVIAPYEQTLNDSSDIELREWSRKVMDAIRSRYGQLDTVIILAGSSYRKYLLDELSSMANQVIVPMEGLSIGKQLRYLGEAKC